MPVVPVKHLLFDLDGTLADTAPDLAYALNLLRQRHGKSSLNYDKIRPVVSHGGNALISLAFGMAETAPGFAPLREEFLQLYRENIHRHTTLFPGIETVLDTLENRLCRWGIVTNKPAWLTNPLIAAIGLDKRTNCVISGDTLPFRKPHPQPLLHACRLLDTLPQETAYIGDAQRDIEAGRNAGMSTLLAAYGYLEEDASPETWGADIIVDEPAEILEWLTHPIQQ